VDASAPLDAALATHPITVLLVDDQAMVCEAVRRLLVGEKDIIFRACQDPTAALALSETLSPTVILQDLVMPQVDGLTLVRRFRAAAHTRDVPLIVLSTQEDPKVKAEAFACGANDYIVKLPDKVELIARIRYHSRGYISLLERNEAFAALQESGRQLEKRNRLIRETFGRYLSDEVVNSLLETPEGLNLGGEKREVTIMMTDLRGFTALAERLSPEEVVATINNYFEVMTEVIAGYGGTINELIGDGLLVVFGAPLRRADHAEAAVACALAMQLAMGRVNEKNRAQGLPRVEMGVGLNTGEVVVGNIGSARRAKYTIVGSNVNLAARIESYTAGEQIMISASTRAALDGLVEVGSSIEVSPKGFKEPIRIYEAVGMGGRHDLHLPKDGEPLRPLSTTIGVRFTLIDDKQAGGPLFEGELIATSARQWDIHTSETVAAFTNLKIELLTRDQISISGNIYGKVVQPLDGMQEHVMRVRLTSIPDEARSFLRSHLAEEAE
jgi:adenylate cyclase